MESLPRYPQTMWKSALKKRAVGREHARNFQAGQVTVNERALHRTGLRGRKIAFCACLLLLVCIIAIGNLVITAYILGALRFTVSGSALIYFTGSSVVFPGSAAINVVQVGQSGVTSPPGSPLEVTADGSQKIVMQGGSYRNTPHGGSVLPPSQVQTEGNGRVSMEPFSSFHVGGQGVEEALRVSESTVVAQGPDAVSQLTVDSTLTTNEVLLKGSSPPVCSSGRLVMRGGAGVQVTSGQNITLSSTTGGIHFTAHKLQPDVISTVSSLEVLSSTGGVVLASLEGGGSGSAMPSFKLCACGSGKLFLVDSQTKDGCSSSTHLCSP